MPSKLRVKKVLTNEGLFYFEQPKQKLGKAKLFLGPVVDYGFKQYFLVL